MARAPADYLPEDEDFEDAIETVDHALDAASASAPEDEDEDEDEDDAVFEDEDEDEDEDTEADTEADEDEDEDEDTGEDEDEDENLDTPVRKKNRKTARSRISELTRQLREAERARFEAEMQAQRAAPPSEEAEPPLVEPKTTDFEYGEFDPKYINALADYRADVKVRERMKETTTALQRQKAAEQQEHYRRRLNTVLGQGADKYDDFEDVVHHTPFDPDLARLVLDSNIAVDIAYYLGNNLKALRRITAMSASDRSRAIGRLEGRFSASSAVRKKTRSKAPETPGGRRKKPINSRASSSKYGPSDQDAFDKAFFQT